MNPLAAVFRKEAKEKGQAAKTLLDAEDFDVNAKKQALFIVGQVAANNLSDMASLIEYLSSTGAIDAKQSRREQLMEKTNAIRTAAAAGDWDEFDRIVESFGNPGGDGG